MEEKDLTLLALEARKDNDWVKKVQQAKSKEEYLGLYKEKGIEFDEEIQGKLSFVFSQKELGQLGDEELDQVSGGVENPLPTIPEIVTEFMCPRQYNWAWCIAHLCPWVQHLGWGDADCNKGYWKQRGFALLPK